MKRRGAHSDTDRKIRPSGVVCSGSACAGQTCRWCPFIGAGKPLSYKLGVSAKLASKLKYLWYSCTSELSEQNDLFWLTYALETAKDMHWNYRPLSDREWSVRYAIYNECRR